MKSGGQERVLTCRQKRAADATAGPARMDEEGADAGGVLGGIEKGVLPCPAAITAEHGLAPAPATAADGLAVCLDHEIGGVVDEVAVHPKDRAKRRRHLRGRVVPRLQGAHGERNELLQRGNV